MAHAWSDLPKALGGESTIGKLNEALGTDGQYRAFTTTDAIVNPVTFGIKSADNDSTILVNVANGKGSAELGSPDKAKFTLVALPEQWEEFFKPVPKMPYQSYWGMYGMNIKQQGVEATGDQEAFGQYAHVWRRALELLHDAHCGPTPLDEDAAETDDDYITGRYIYVTAPGWGRCKIFVEKSGVGKQPILFLHTAGSDSRQYHGVMNDRRLRDRLTMYAFDLPAHGRSFPPQGYLPGAHTTTEDAYVGCIAQVVAKLQLVKPIICGASMAGQACLAIAMRNAEVKAGGTIPLQACARLTMSRFHHDKSPSTNAALFAPESVLGMMSPTAPARNKGLLYHTYSAQAYGIFHGDLDFYFGGWDGRARLAKINTAACPVYMLTGEYDWSTTPDVAEATAKEIPGAKHTVMEGLGHFPATENPARFVPYLLEGVEWIQRERKERGDLSVLRMTDD
ncbi:alpha beta hydrolase fold family protein [Diplodia corticola]|uniref:Alpha beta hydrolase fold family protein n=1 Tax=Diplodia corticola TaxID=236234 RepID=A0A1J9S9E0_9PEZI|nr:alpha beta hydrolase fold family protein [Diplodia corticola]OJD36508.1 alpha beta hydrolase fold family protein [Diplodia corticola]